MKNKDERLMAIRRMIGTDKFSSQEELLKILTTKGFNMTQATLSRDLKYLKVAKMPDNENGYYYMLQSSESQDTSVIRWDFPPNALLTIEFAQGMGLIKTLPGFAGGIASAIDARKIPEVAGTVAGDDTILLIPRDGIKRNEIVNRLAKYIPGIKTKVVW